MQSYPEAAKLPFSHFTFDDHRYVCVTFPSPLLSYTPPPPPLRLSLLLSSPLLSSPPLPCPLLSSPLLPHSLRLQSLPMCVYRVHSFAALWTVSTVLILNPELSSPYSPRWAVSTIMTRLNRIPSAEGQSTLALIPMWDMCNHCNGEVSCACAVSEAAAHISQARVCEICPGLPNAKQRQREFDSFTPKFKNYILPTFWREMYKWGS